MFGKKIMISEILLTAVMTIALIGCGDTTTQQTTRTHPVPPTHTSARGGTPTKVGTYGTTQSIQEPSNDGASGNVKVTVLSDKTYKTLSAAPDMLPYTSHEGYSYLVIKLYMVGNGIIDAAHFSAIDQHGTKVSIIKGFVGTDTMLNGSHVISPSGYNADLLVIVSDTSTSITLTYSVSGMPVANWNLSSTYWGAQGGNSMTTLLDYRFNGKILNKSIWNVIDYRPGGYVFASLKPYNSGIQAYQPESVKVANGIVSLRLARQSVSIGKVGTFDYTSGAVTTEHKFTFLYGRIDIVARIPATQGSWPALWLLTEDGSHELDIMESINVDTELYSSCHVHVPVPFTFNAGTQTTVANMGASMHTYSVIWKQDSITWLFDNKEVFSYSNKTGNIPHTPMFLIMDNAVGGEWGGPPDSTSIFPQSMDIDSVHVVSLS